MSTASLTTAADWAGAFSELPTLPEDAADAFLAKTYAICDSGSWRTAMIGFLTTFSAQVRPQWMPIESAPKDGNERVLITDGKRVTTAVWTPNVRERWEIVDGDTQKRVVTDDSYWSPDDNETYGPTHWQPLPSPPGSPSSQTDTGDNT